MKSLLQRMVFVFASEREYAAARAKHGRIEWAIRERLSRVVADEWYAIVGTTWWDLRKTFASVSLRCYHIPTAEESLNVCKSIETALQLRGTWEKSTDYGRRPVREFLQEPGGAIKWSIRADGPGRGYCV